ncbi:MAG: hypothetical protein KAX20_01665 [Candidatus Omnitrophica bacterium]|nr:hypothetical protein [Candidatus Omnitrophota bacterium]
MEEKNSKERILFSLSHKEPDRQQKLPDGTYKDIWGVKRRKIAWRKGSYLEVVESPLAEVKNAENREPPLARDRAF